MVSENVEGFQILPRLPNPALPNHVLPNTAYASKYCLCFQLPNSALPYQNCPQYGMLNLPESGSCPKPNPMVSKNVEGFQILHFHIRTVHNMDDGIFQNLEALRKRMR